jgi:hypothetical protein
MNRKVRILLLLIITIGTITVGAWRVVRVKEPGAINFISNAASVPVDYNELWGRAVERVTEDRGAMGGAAVETPTQLRHYSDRHWFLASQVAEVKKFNLQSCQDYVELAAMIERGELVTLPAVTETYVLFGVGARADDSDFNRYEDGKSFDLYSEAELQNAYSRIESERSRLQAEVTGLKSQQTSLKKNESAKQAQIQRDLNTREQKLKENEDAKAELDQSYGQLDQRRRLLSDYNSLQTLATNFVGRSFNLADPNDRKVFKVSLLSSLRPEALKVLEEIAKTYHDQFDRPLPVSSLIRPEQYQHALRRVNRYAVLIETPPHTTGLAFDIDYRYMSGAEQNFVMAELARLKDAGRIEVIRERGANYHVFAFIDGQRPPDDLIAASLEEAGGPTADESQPNDEQTKVEKNSRSATKATAKMKNRRPNSKTRKRR